MTSYYPNPDQSQPKSDLTAAGAAALDAYLTTCRKNALVPDVGGAWANAFRAGADYAAQAMATQAGPATWDLIEQLVQLECTKTRLLQEFMGKSMPADVYLRFQKLRDERIPELQMQLQTFLAATESARCLHRIADARNPVVKSGYFCIDCGSIFSAADHDAQAEPTNAQIRWTAEGKVFGRPTTHDLREALAHAVKTETLVCACPTCVQSDQGQPADAQDAKRWRSVAHDLSRHDLAVVRVDEDGDCEMLTGEEANKAIDAAMAAAQEGDKA